MKDKKWLKEQLVKLKKETDERNKYGSNYTDEQLVVRRIRYLADQLDEPQQDIDAAHDLLAKITTLSQEDFDLYWNCINDGVAVSELKQEKLVIPQFVGDWIDLHKEDNLNLGDALNTHYEDEREIHRWLYMEGSGNNDEIFARAWLDGYSVEKEKLYKVLLPGVESLDRQMRMHEETKVISFADDGYNCRKYSKDDEFIRLFTEHEIKAIDERYWAFAEEVTE